MITAVATESNEEWEHTVASGGHVDAVFLLELVDLAGEDLVVDSSVTELAELAETPKDSSAEELHTRTTRSIAASRRRGGCA